MNPRKTNRGFTLLEVMIALSILAVSLMIMLEMQTTSVILTSESEKISTATGLADEKMREVLVVLEREGWSSRDIAEQGDFLDFGAEDFRGDSLRIETEDLSEYYWAYTVRAVELNLPDGGAEGMASDLMGSSNAAQTAADQGASGLPSLSDLGIDAAVIGEFLENYVREVRVIVWWGDNEDELDQIELVHHAIDPSGLGGASQGTAGS